MNKIDQILKDAWLDMRGKFWGFATELDQLCDSSNLSNKLKVTNNTEIANALDVIKDLIENQIEKP